MTRSARRIAGTLAAVSVAVLGCSTSGPELDNDRLSTLLSIGAVTKTPTPDGTDPDRVTRLTIDTTVINTGFITIDVPFRMTWSVRRDGAILGTGTRDFDAGFRPGDSVPVRLTVRFEPSTSLGGTADVVTFDILGDTPLNVLGN